MLIGCCAKIEDYESVRRAGFDYMELPGSLLSRISESEFEDWRRLINGGELPVWGLNASITPDVKICGAGFSPEKTKSYGDLLCRRASALGVERIGVGSPASRDYRQGDDLDRAWRQTESFLAILCACARPYGIEILWEPINPSEADFGLDSRESAEHIGELRKKGVFNLGLVCDLYHTVCKGETVDTAEIMAPLTKHLHIASALDGRRGFVTEADERQMLPFLRVFRSAGVRTISAEAFSGDILRDGAASVSILKEWDRRLS